MVCGGSRVKFTFSVPTTDELRAVMALLVAARETTC